MVQATFLPSGIIRVNDANARHAINEGHCFLVSLGCVCFITVGQCRTNAFDAGAQR